MTMSLITISSLILSMSALVAMQTVTFLHLKLLDALKNNRDFIVYFAAAYNKDTNATLESVIKTKFTFNFRAYVTLTLLSILFAEYSLVFSILGGALFMKDIKLFSPFWKTLFPAISRARYFPIQPPPFD